MQFKRVVVTGIGTINPLGNNIQEYFDNLDEGKSGASLITRFDTAPFKTKFACEIKDYDPAKYGIDRKEARKLDLYSQYALIALSYSSIEKYVSPIASWLSSHSGFSTAAV